MDLREYYAGLFEYNNWANQLTYDSIIRTEKIDYRAARLFSHIVAAQKIWLGRVTKKGDNPLLPWDEIPAEHSILLSREIGDDWLNFTKGSSEEKLLIEISYENSRGNKYTNRIIDIIAHVINHSTYHRGQIAALVAASGGTPALTDYIFYKRR